MTQHAVVIAGGGPTGTMLASDRALDAEVEMLIASESAG